MFIQEKWVTWPYVGGAGVPTIMRGTVMSYYFITVVKISCRSILSFKFVDKIYISHMSILIFTNIWIPKMKVCSMQLHSIYIYSTFRSFNLLSLSFLLSFDTNSSTNTSLLAHPSICRSFFSSHIFRTRAVIMIRGEWRHSALIPILPYTKSIFIQILYIESW